MKIPSGIAEKLRELKQGMKVPYSRLKHPVIESMLDNGVVHRQIQGRSKCMIYLTRPQALDAYLSNHYGINDLDQYILYLNNESATRADGVQVATDSKTKTVRTFKGFLVTSVKPISCLYKGSEFIIDPAEGTFAFIYDYEDFIPGKETTIVGIENPEVFRYISKCAHYFPEKDLLFVSRYPQSKDLVKWLKLIPNSYLHFGDADYAGINIYYNEFKKYLGSRASIFIPPGVDQLLPDKGNRDNYNNQTLLIDKSSIDEPGILHLIRLIEESMKGLEQEIFLVMNDE